jgi:hypothetical protein
VCYRTIDSILIFAAAIDDLSRALYATAVYLLMVWWWLQTIFNYKGPYLREQWELIKLLTYPIHDVDKSLICVQFSASDEDDSASEYEESSASEYEESSASECEEGSASEYAQRFGSTHEEGSSTELSGTDLSDEESSSTELSSDEDSHAEGSPESDGKPKPPHIPSKL